MLFYVVSVLIRHPIDDDKTTVGVFCPAWENGLVGLAV
jgi:hypothetical protein